ncbi:MAG: DUF3179 domain-containing protein [Planctomycetes bacterium]|nr:DUF3179 domain-containing protein [Planctomycetota bacterium]
MSIAACVASCWFLLAPSTAFALPRLMQSAPEQYGPPAPNTNRLALRERSPQHVDLREILSPESALEAGIGTDETVLGVRIGDAVRAYPIARIAVDEVMNDTIDNVAIAITW